MKIIAVDPGYDRCGLAVIEKLAGGKDALIESGCIVTNQKQQFELRLHEVVSVFRSWVMRHEVSVCALERLFFTKNQKTAMRVAETRGALIYAAQDMNLKIYEYGPGEIKIAITGDGSASKQQLISMLGRLIKIEKPIRFDDEYDAIAVALTASASIRP